MMNPKKPTIIEMFKSKKEEHKEWVLGFALTLILAVAFVSALIYSRIC